MREVTPAFIVSHAELLRSPANVGEQPIRIIAPISLSSLTEKQEQLLSQWEPTRPSTRSGGEDDMKELRQCVSSPGAARLEENASHNAHVSITSLGYARYKLFYFHSLTDA